MLLGSEVSFIFSFLNDLLVLLGWAQHPPRKVGRYTIRNQKSEWSGANIRVQWCIWAILRVEDHQRRGVEPKKSALGIVIWAR